MFSASEFLSDPSRSTGPESPEHTRQVSSPPLNLNGSVPSEAEAAALSRSLKSIPLYFLFRENHIYERYLQPIVYGLVEQGWSVRGISFPAATDGTAIARELAARSEDLRRGALFADRTTASRLPSGVLFPGLASSTLDNIFSGTGLTIVCRQLGLRQLFDVEVPDTPGVPFMTAYLDAHRARFQMVLQKALERESPDWILIDSRKLNEHIPFHILPEKNGEAVAARYLREWLVGLPFPEDRICITRNLSKLAPTDFAGTERMWIFGDRHWQDTPKGQSEIAGFVRRVERCTHEQALTLALEATLLEEAEDDSRAEVERRSNAPWDGDDGVDECDRIDYGIEPDETWDDESLLSDDPHSSLDSARIDAALRRLTVVPEVPHIKVGLLPLPMDSLLENLVSSGMLPVEHFRQAAALVTSVQHEIEGRLSELARRVLLLTPT